MTNYAHFLDARTTSRSSARWLTSGLLLGCLSLSGCSLKDTSHLTKGESKAKGGEVGTGGQGDGGAAGGADGGTAAGGSSTVECGANEITCPGQLECVDLAVGNKSASTVENCGSCDTTCSVANVKTGVCEAGVCKPVCAAGFADCNDVSLNDGCEASVSTATACGSCGRTCSLSGVAAQACTAGKCAPICLERHADCNQDTGIGTDDGCEVDLNTLTLCGADCTTRAACTATQVCNATGCGAPQGIVQMSVPFTATAQSNRFSNKFAMTPDLTDDKLTVRMYAPHATGGYISLYASDGDYTAGSVLNVPFSSLTERWIDINLNVGKVLGAFDPSTVNQLNFDIYTEGTGPWANPTLIYVESLWSSDGSVKEDFNDTIGQFIPSTRMTVDGSTLTWLPAMP